MVGHNSTQGASPYGPDAFLASPLPRQVPTRLTAIGLAWSTGLVPTRPTEVESECACCPIIWASRGAGACVPTPAGVWTVCATCAGISLTFAGNTSPSAPVAPAMCAPGRRPTGRDTTIRRSYVSACPAPAPDVGHPETGAGQAGRVDSPSRGASVSTPAKSGRRRDVPAAGADGRERSRLVFLTRLFLPACPIGSCEGIVL